MDAMDRSPGPLEGHTVENASGIEGDSIAPPRGQAQPLETGMSTPLSALEKALNGVIEGQERVVRLALTCLLARGHLLLEDAPGTGKTTLSRALAQASGLEFRRVQMTADLMPTDITGARIPAFGMAGGSPVSDGPALRLVPGPIFSEVVLADELNRTPPRTQSALLEAMAEGSVTIEGETHPLPDPFFVVATQNPMEFAGTFPLPESQLDRFMMRLAPGYPSRDSERRMLQSRRSVDPLDGLASAIERQELERAMAEVLDVAVPAPVEEYLLDLVAATRVRDQFLLGASPRAALDLDRAARAFAWIDGRDFVTPDDVRYLAIPVLAHRLVPREIAASASAEECEALLGAVLDQVAAPKIGADGSLSA